MTSFGWLHLTDLHLGMGDQPGLLPTVRDRIFDDLKLLYEKSQPWDLVIFTGDLTQRGSQDEFMRLDDFLDQLWDCLRTLGAKPSLVAVPGNHDLARPDSKDPWVQLLRKTWVSDKEMRDEFWKNQDSNYRKTVAEAFKNYAEWWSRTQFKLPASPGMLPGDFSATLNKGEASLGIVGLNTTFLQLTEGDYKGKLALHPAQFHGACEGDGPAWVKKHHTCLLLTHQPPDWLAPESRLDLESEIAGYDHFATHLFGHMHETRYQAESKGGAPELRTFQGTSLFGLEFLDDSKSVERRHGYCTGRIDLEGENGNLTFWPRRGNRSTGQWNIVPDTDIYVIEEHTRPKSFPLKKPFALQSESVTGVVQQGPIDQSTRSRWAVLVGVNEYQHFAKLQYCRQDAVVLARAFRESLGFQHVFEIHEEADIKPDRESILRKLGDLRDSGEPRADDLFVFYFSGHGIAEDGVDYLLPIGARARDVKLLGVKVEDVVELLKAIGCNDTLMFIDACRETVSGAKGTLSVGASSNQIISDAGIVAFFSCGPQDRSYEIESLRHGSFTYCILEAIKDGTVSTVSDLDQYLKEHVPRINARYQKPSQQPYTVYKSEEQLALAIVPGQVTERFEAEIARLAKLSADGKIGEDEFVSAIGFLSVVRSKSRLDTSEMTKLAAIRSLCDETWSPETFRTVWKSIKVRPLGGPRIRKNLPGLK